MGGVINHYLLVYDHALGALIEVREFGPDAAAATAEYSQLERMHRTDLHIDIVLVGSDSLESVRVTHSTYFGGQEATDLRQLLRLDEVTAQLR